MVYVQTSKDKLENLKERLIIEIVEQQKKVNNSSNPFEKKISMINWTLDTIDSNPSMTIQELADLIEYRLRVSKEKLIMLNQRMNSPGFLMKSEY